MNKKHSYAKITTLFLVAALALCLVVATPTSSDAEPSFWKRQQAGIRLGVWDNRGDVHPQSNETLKHNIGDKSFFAELYGSWRLFDRGYLEVSLGFVNRGDVSFFESEWVFDQNNDSVEIVDEFYGNLILYPVLAQFKYYLPGFRTAAFKPYGQAGGGLFLGRNSVQFTNSNYLNIQEQSATKFGFVFGGGVDWQLSHNFGVELNARYMSVEFGKVLIDTTDYSSLAVAVGVKYLFIPTKKKPGTKNRR